MVLRKFENGIKFIEITGVGENISDETKRIYFSKSGAEAIKDVDEMNSEILNELELYHNKKGQAILTRKKDNKTITFNDYVESSFRGTSWIEEIKKGEIESATGSGRIGEHTEFVATLKDGGYLIVGFNGRYEAGYKIYKNDGGVLKSEIFANSGKYVDMFPLEEAKMLMGIKSVCEVISEDEKAKAEKIKEILGVEEVEIDDSCGEVEYIVKKDGVKIIIKDIETIN